MVDREPDDDGAPHVELDQVLADYMERLDRGEFVDRERFVAEHPDFAGDLYIYFEGSDDLMRLTLPAYVAEQEHTMSLTREEAPVAAAGSKTRDHVPYFGDYELLEEIARWGMGVVYKARQVSLNRPVALKMILDGRLASSADVARFRIEAEAAANLDHPHIVPIYEIGEHLGQHYFSMKLIRGGSLDDPSVRPGSDLRAVARLVATIARTVHHAHMRGILHRDLKPANILIDAEGGPHLTDFGLARRVGGEASHSSGGGIAGTPSYMAPEQAIGRCRELTTAVDVYGIGVILYELLVGHPPFRGDSPVEIIWRVVEQPPPSLRAQNRSIPRDLETICLKCLEKEPGRRFRSAEALAEDLERWLDGRTILAQRTTLPERSWRWCRRNPVLATLIATVASLLVAIALSATSSAARLRESLTKVEIAEREGREKLWESYLAQAQANRYSGHLGRQFGSLEVLAKAAAIRPDPRLRDEALACLPLLDLRLIRRWEAFPAGSQVWPAFDGECQRYVRFSAEGTASVRRVDDDQEIVRIPCRKGWNHWPQFERQGRFLHWIDQLPSHEWQFELWDVSRGKRIALDPPSPVGPRSDFRRDGRELAKTSADSVEFYDLPLGKRIGGWSVGGRAIHVRYHPDGRRLAVQVENEAAIRICDRDTGKVIQRFELPGSAGDVDW
ncbi:MAG TPA: protein kinase, partial [Isosphaeraceae bacterium]|nr:protein kinase [Isosphaeraceae bacterium]